MQPKPAQSLFAALLHAIVYQQLSGKAAATILGAVGGAAVGNRIAGGNNAYANTPGPVYRVSVQTDNGQLRTYDVSATGDLRPGDRVRIENGVIYLA